MATLAGRRSGGVLPGWLRIALCTRGGALAVFVARRVLWMVPIVFFVIVITFVLMHLAPEAIDAKPTSVVFPALAIGFTLLAFSFVGDGLRDALDPRMRR